MEQKKSLKCHLVAVPAVGHRRPQSFNTNHLQHVLIGRVGGNHLVVGQLVVLHDAWAEINQHVFSSGSKEENIVTSQPINISNTLMNNYLIVWSVKYQIKVHWAFYLTKYLNAII